MALQFDNIMRTFVADVESCVVVRLIGDELDSHSRALADHSLEGYLIAVTRVKEHNGASIQSAPQDQPARPELMGSRLDVKLKALEGGWLKSWSPHGAFPT